VTARRKPGGDRNGDVSRESAAKLTGAEAVGQIRARPSECTPLLPVLERLSRETAAFADGTFASEVDLLLADLRAINAEAPMLRHLARIAAGQAPVTDREIAGPYVQRVTRRGTDHLNLARRRLDALLLEADTLAGLGPETITTKTERRRTGRAVHEQAVKTLRELSAAEGTLEELRAALEDSSAPVTRGFQARIAWLRLVES
jgi:hypothetical protein